MTVIMPDSATISTKPDGDSAGLPAPAWATSFDNDHQGSVTWSHKIELLAVDDGGESLRVEAHLLDYFDASITTGVRVERCTPEIQITRLNADGKANPNEFPLRFEIANARRVIAALQECIDTVEGTTAVTLWSRN
jgi:hypothetical protein